MILYFVLLYFDFNVVLSLSVHVYENQILLLNILMAPGILVRFVFSVFFFLSFLYLELNLELNMHFFPPVLY